MVRVDEWSTVCKSNNILNYLHDFIDRHPTYQAAMPPLQAFFEAISRQWARDSADADDTILVTHKLCFLRSLLYLDRSRRTEMPRGDFYDELFKIGINASSEETFAESFQRAIHPKLDPNSYTWLCEWQPKILAEFTPEWEDGELEPLVTAMEMELRYLEFGSVAETSTGFFAIVPRRTKVGDQICVLEGATSLSILKAHRSGHYEHVGLCYSVGLSNGEAKEFLMTGRARIERLELR